MVTWRSEGKLTQVSQLILPPIHLNLHFRDSPVIEFLVAEQNINPIRMSLHSHVCICFESRMVFWKVNTWWEGDQYGIIYCCFVFLKSINHFNSSYSANLFSSVLSNSASGLKGHTQKRSVSLQNGCTTCKGQVPISSSRLYSWIQEVLEFWSFDLW